MNTQLIQGINSWLAPLIRHPPTLTLSTARSVFAFRRELFSPQSSSFTKLFLQNASEKTSSRDSTRDYLSHVRPWPYGACSGFQILDSLCSASIMDRDRASSRERSWPWAPLSPRQTETRTVSQKPDICREIEARNIESWKLFDDVWAIVIWRVGKRYGTIESGCIAS